VLGRLLIRAVSSVRSHFVRKIVVLSDIIAIYEFGPLFD
jgi:hypothetical protein